MNFLKSRWTAAIVAILINLGITAHLIMSQQAVLFANLPQVRIETPPLLWSFKDTEVEKLIAELRTERKKLDARESDLDKMAARLATEREELVKVQGDIQAARDQLSASIVEMQEGESGNLKTLATTYSTMAAPAVVSIFTEMDENLVVKILSLMKADKVGAIFQEMARPRTPDNGLAKKAARISDKLRLLKAKKDQP